MGLIMSDSREPLNLNIIKGENLNLHSPEDWWKLVKEFVGEPQGEPYIWLSFPYTFQRVEEIYKMHFDKANPSTEHK